MSRRKGLTEEKIRDLLVATSVSDSEGEEFDCSSSGDEFILINENISSDSEEESNQECSSIRTQGMYVYISEASKSITFHASLYCYFIYFYSVFCRLCLIIKYNNEIFLCFQMKMKVQLVRRKEEGFLIRILSLLLRIRLCGHDRLLTTKT